MKTNITLGSLFDGIGGFVYAASLYGIKTLWASEIIPAAISVTRRHFPEMEHIGDITKLHGGEIAPVDIITFGSPCQSFSIAGGRKGLDGKSGLFWEAIRIIREMRTATNGKYPRYSIFENVPGILSSNRGRDYKTVLEAFTETEIPFPASGRWTKAGMVRGGGIDFAWIIHDAQYFGVAQRRRRLFAVCDFTGQRAAEILFKPKSLHRYFTQSGEARKGTAPHASGGADGASVDSLTPPACHPQIAGTLCASGAGLSRPAGMGSETDLCIVTETDPNPAVCGTLCAKSIAPNGIGNETDMCILQEAQAFTHLGFGHYCESGKSKTILSNDKAATADIVTIPINDKATRHKGGGDTRNCDGSGNGLGIGKNGDPAPTITAGDRHAVAAYCLQGNMIGREEENGPRGTGINKDLSFTLNTVDKHAVAAVFNRQRSDSFKQDDLASTQTARQSKDATDLVCDATVKNIVRRLTPTECERLQGYDDGWTEYGHDGKPLSDTARYQALGNSVAIPCVAYVISGIVDELRRKDL